MRRSFYYTALFVVAATTSGFEMILTHVGDTHSRIEETDRRGNVCDASNGHGCYGGMARLAGAIAAARSEAADQGLPFLFLVAGDNYQGTAYYSFFKWKPIAEFVNALAPDVTTLGNHEFDDGPEGLLPYLKATAERSPVVTTNVVMDAADMAAGSVRASWTATLTDRRTGNSTVVGVVGYVTRKSEFTSNPDRIKFTDEIVSLKKEVAKLKNNGVNIIIGLGHSGIEVDKTIATEVDGIDMIVGGHSHTFLYTGKPPDDDKPSGPYPTWVTTVTGKQVPILHAFAYTKYLGKVYLRFSENGVLEEINGNPILLDSSIPQDLSVLKLVDKWKSKLTNVSSVYFAETTVDLVNECRVDECNIGNVIADSFVYYNIFFGDKLPVDGGWTDAPIAIVQAGGIRASIESASHGGKINLAQLITAMPFMNKLVKVTISGKNLLEAFENSVRKYITLQGHGSFLQVSGAQVEYDLSRNPGNRVVSLNLRCGRCVIPKFKPVDPGVHYTVLMSDYLAAGGDQYTSLKSEVSNYKSLRTMTYNATAVFMNATSPIRTEPKGTRIRFTNNSKTSNDDTKMRLNRINFEQRQLNAMFELRSTRKRLGS